MRLKLSRSLVGLTAALALVVGLATPALAAPAGALKVVSGLDRAELGHSGAHHGPVGDRETDDGETATTAEDHGGQSHRATVVAGSAASADDDDLDLAEGKAERTDAEKIAAIANQFKVDRATVEALHTQQKLGLGVIVHLLDLANRSGKSVNDLLALFQQGTGLGKLAKENNIHPGSLAHPGAVFGGKPSVGAAAKAGPPAQTPPGKGKAKGRGR